MTDRESSSMEDPSDPAHEARQSTETETPAEKSRLQLCIEAIENASSELSEKITTEFFPDDENPKHIQRRDLAMFLASPVEGDFHWDADQHSHVDDHKFPETVIGSPRNEVSSGNDARPPGPLIESDPKRLGQYQVIGYLGQGGMGIVYRVHNESLERDEALKLMLGISHINQVVRDRFELEARTLARFDHPHVLGIYAVHDFDGRPCITMPLVEADSLETLISIADGALPDKKKIREFIIILEKIALGVHYCHTKGIIHRDIKPSNILVTKEDGTPLLADFGLAKEIDRDSDHTIHGAFLGTRTFASPEQLEGFREIDQVSDVFSLGATLFAAVTSRVAKRHKPPSSHDGKSFDGITGSAFPWLRTVNPNGSKSLATVCEKALTWDRDSRFQSAKEFADELRRIIDDKPILSSRTTLVEHATSWARRNQWAALAIGMACILVLMSSWMWFRRPAHLIVNVEPPNASVTLDGLLLPIVDGAAKYSGSPGMRSLEVNQTGFAAYSQPVDLARGVGNTQSRAVRLIPLQGRLEVNSFPTGADVVVRDVSGEVVASGTTPLRTQALPSGTAFIEVTKPLFRSVKNETTIPRDFATNPLQKIILEPAFSQELGSAFLADQIISMRDPFDEILVAEDLTIEQIAQEASRLSGKQLTVSEDSTVKGTSIGELRADFSAASLRQLSQRLREQLGLTLICETNESFGQANQWRILSVADSERQLLTGLYSTKALNLSTPPQQLISLVQANISRNQWEALGGVFSIQAVEQGDVLAVTCNMSTHEMVANYLVGLSDLVDRDQVSYATGESVWRRNLPIGTVKIVDPDSGLSVDPSPDVLRGLGLFVLDLAFVNNELLLSAGEDGAVRLWNLSTQKVIHQYETGNRRVNCLLPIPDSQQFAVGNGIGVVSLFALDNEAPLQSELRHLGDVTAMALSTDSSHFFSVGSDGSIIRYTLPDLEYDSSIKMQDSLIDAQIYDERTLLVTGLYRREVIHIESRKWFAVNRYPIDQGPSNMIMVSVNPKRPKQIITSGSRLARWNSPGMELAALNFSRFQPSSAQTIAKFHGRPHYVTGHRDGRVIIRRVADHEPVAVLRPGHDFGRSSIAVSPDDDKLAIATWQLKDGSWQSLVHVYHLDWTDNQ